MAWAVEWETSEALNRRATERPTLIPWPTQNPFTRLERRCTPVRGRWAVTCHVLERIASGGGAADPIHRGCFKRYAIPSTGLDGDAFSIYPGRPGVIRTLRPHMNVMASFDYNAPAELFAAKANSRTAIIKYRRFLTAAEAIRFAIEDLPAHMLNGAALEVEEQRFDHRQIRQLYSAVSRRRPAKAQAGARKSP